MRDDAMRTIRDVDTAKRKAVRKARGAVSLAADAKILLEAKQILDPTDFLNWGEQYPAILWTGVGIQNDRVTKLELADIPLGGRIPPQIGQLDKLRTLNLTNAQLSGSIPPELGDLKNLEFLLLNHNNLFDALPDELGKLDKLKILGIRVGNHLTHYLPTGLVPLVKSGKLITDVELRDVRRTVPQMVFGCQYADCAAECTYPADMLYWFVDGWYCDECLHFYLIDIDGEDIDGGKAADEKSNGDEKWYEKHKGMTLKQYLQCNNDQLLAALMHSY